jgi:myo-inositol catabolism protein IolC
MTKEEWHRQQAELCRRLAWLTSLRRDADVLRAMAEDHLRQAERLAERASADSGDGHGAGDAAHHTV